MHKRLLPLRALATPKEPNAYQITLATRFGFRTTMGDGREKQEEERLPIVKKKVECKAVQTKRGESQHVTGGGKRPKVAEEINKEGGQKRQVPHAPPNREPRRTRREVLRLKGPRM